MAHKLRQSVLPAFMLAGLALALFSLWISVKHLEAESFLDRIDFRARPASGTTFFATPKRLAVKQRVSLPNIEAHLKKIGFFADAGSHEPGSYELREANELFVNSRLPEFPSLRLTFRNGRITGIGKRKSTEGVDYEPVQQTLIEPEPLGSFILSIEGDDLSRMFVRRRVVGIGDLKNSYLYDALLASEDSLFLRHNGNRFDRVLAGLLPGGIGGGSSLSAQFVKNAVSLDRTKSIGRKIDEMFLTSSLEARMSKDEIITGYANNVFLGGGAGTPNLYGFGAAEQEYFGKDRIGDLSLAEAATLVAILPRPNTFLQASRKGDFDDVRKARNRVLTRLRATWPGKYSDLEVRAAQSEEVKFGAKAYVEQPLDILARPFVKFASQRQHLIQLEGLRSEQYSGLHVFTSLDPDLTRSAQEILDREIPKVRMRFPPSGGGSCALADERLLGAIVALDPESGAVVVMSGSGGGPDGAQFATLALNATTFPASTIKPFSVAKALESAVGKNRDQFTAAQIVPSQPPLRVRPALAASDDDFGFFAANQAGVSEVASFFGLATGLTLPSPTQKFALGFGEGSEVSPLRYARAYSVFVAGSIPDLVPVEAVYLDGKRLETTKSRKLRLLDSGAAFITAQMMRSVLGYGPDGDVGTGRRAAQLAGPVIRQTEIGAKTGSGPHAVWMMSIGPRLVVAVVLTYKCHSDIHNAAKFFAGETAAIIWANFVRDAETFRPDLFAGEFQRPSNVVEATIDPKRGCQSDSVGIREYFLQGALPRHC